MASEARWRADVARRTTARMRRNTKATWQGRGQPTQGVDTWQEATRVHANAHVGRHMAGGGRLVSILGR